MVEFGGLGKASKVKLLRLCWLSMVMTVDSDRHIIVKGLLMWTMEY